MPQPHALLLIALVLGAGLRAEGELGLVRLLPGYRTAESFVTIGEHFGRAEHTGGRQVVRSQPGERAGYYFLVRLSAERPWPKARVEVDVILPGALEPRPSAFTVDLDRGQPVLHVGVTGSDWPGPDVAPLAWRIVIRDGESGRLLLEERSFLWAVPPGPPAS
jgi:hypothetical protein